MRPLICEIRLDRLKNNYQTLKSIHGNKLLAIVKADAYGHGAIKCAQALNTIADGFGVAMLEEAQILRENGITKPIVLLEGVFEATEYTEIERLNLWPVIHHQAQLETFLAHDWKRPNDVWLKMDSGMHRAGFFPHNYAAAYTTLRQSPKVANIVKMSHLACADEEERSMTEKQLATFDKACVDLEGEESLTNSAALLNYPQARRDWGRAGLALYGISPFNAPDKRLQAVMKLSTRIFAERILQPNEPVGYGAIFHTQSSTRVGLIACGYADGYPRRAATDTPIAVNGLRTRIIGRVSMDMMTIELNETHEGIGDEVELFGDIVPVHEIAHAADTLSYEIVCNIKRAKKIYSE